MHRGEKPWAASQCSAWPLASPEYQADEEEGPGSSDRMVEHAAANGPCLLAR